MEFTKGGYIKTAVWDGDDYLVQPDTAVKRCRCCGKLKYSVEFINIPELMDGKLPVCLKCYRSRKYKTAVSDIISRLPQTRECRKCEQERPLSLFSQYNAKYNRLDNVCDNCAPARPSFWLDGDDETEDD